MPKVVKKYLKGVAMVDRAVEAAAVKAINGEIDGKIKMHIMTYEMAASQPPVQPTCLPLCPGTGATPPLIDLRTGEGSVRHLMGGAALAQSSSGAGVASARRNLEYKINTKLSTIELGCGVGSTCFHPGSMGIT